MCHSYCTSVSEFQGLLLTWHLLKISVHLRHMSWDSNGTPVWKVYSFWSEFCLQKSWEILSSQITSSTWNQVVLLWADQEQDLSTWVFFPLSLYYHIIIHTPPHQSSYSKGLDMFFPKLFSQNASYTNMAKASAEPTSHFCSSTIPGKMDHALCVLLRFASFFQTIWIYRFWLITECRISCLQAWQPDTGIASVPCVVLG